MPDYADPQSLNRYSYVRGNPASMTDPTGHCFVPIQGAPDCDPLLLAGLDYAYGNISRGQLNQTMYIQLVLLGGAMLSDRHLGGSPFMAPSGPAVSNPCGRYGTGVQCFWYPDGKPRADGEGLWYGSATDANRGYCTDFFGANGGIARGSTCTTFGTSPEIAAAGCSSRAASPHCIDPRVTGGSDDPTNTSGCRHGRECPDPLTLNLGEVVGFVVAVVQGAVNCVVNGAAVAPAGAVAGTYAGSVAPGPGNIIGGGSGAAAGFAAGCAYGVLSPDPITSLGG